MVATNNSNKCSSGDKGKSPMILMEEKISNANGMSRVQESVDRNSNSMSVNIIDVDAPTRPKRRGLPPLHRNLDGKVEQRINVSRPTNKRLLPIAAYKSPSLSSCTPYNKAKYPALTRLSSNMGVTGTSDGPVSIEEAIKTWPKKLKQVEGVNQLSNKCFLPGGFQSRNINILKDNTTDEQNLKRVLESLCSTKVPISQASLQGSSNSPLMTNGTTSWNGNVAKENQSGYNFNHGIGNQSNSGSNGMVNPNNLYGSGFGSGSNSIDKVNQNSLFPSGTAKSNQVSSEFGMVNRNKLFGSNFSHDIGNHTSFDTGSSSGNIVNQNNIFGSTNTNVISNKGIHIGSRTNAVCTNKNPTFPPLPPSHGRHYLHAWSIYRDSTKKGGKSRDNPKESSSVVENGGKEDKGNTYKGKEPMADLETGEIAASEGYNCQPVVPEERPNEYKQGSSMVTPISPLNESERYEMEDADLPYLDEYGNSTFFPEENYNMKKLW